MLLSNTNIKNLYAPSNLVFSYGSGRLKLDSNGGYIAGIEIHFEGNINYSFQPVVNKNTISGVGSNKILIVNMTEVILQGELMHYKGFFKITKVIVSDAKGKQVGASVDFRNAKNKPEDMHSNPEDMDIKPEKMNKGYFYGRYKTKKKSVILKKQGKTKKRGQVRGPVSNVSTSSDDDY